MPGKSLGFIGLGSMGIPIAANLISAGFKLFIHTRSRTPENHPSLEGSIICDSPNEVALASDVLFICVRDDQAVEDVIFGEKGVSSIHKAGQIIIDLSTISPSKTRSIHKRLLINKVYFFDAPVTGGTEGAKNASLSMFIGCTSKTLEYLYSILNFIASDIYAFGDIGKGQEVKSINQILVAGCYAGLAEAISLAQHLGLPVELVVNAMQKGAGGSWALTNRSKNMIEKKYPLGFKLSLHHKDLSIALNIAKEKGLKLPITSMVNEIEENLIKKGFSDYDLSVLREST